VRGVDTTRRSNDEARVRHDLFVRVVQGGEDP